MRDSQTVTTARACDALLASAVVGDQCPAGCVQGAECGAAVGLIPFFARAQAPTQPGSLVQIITNTPIFGYYGVLESWPPTAQQTDSHASNSRWPRCSSVSKRKKPCQPRRPLTRRPRKAPQTRHPLRERCCFRARYAAVSSASECNTRALCPRRSKRIRSLSHGFLVRSPVRSESVCCVP